MCTNTSDSAPVTPAQVSMLEHDRRRTVVRSLCSRDGVAPLSAVALSLSSEYACSIPDAIAQLRTVHLPSLEAVDLVEFDARTGTVALVHGKAHAERALARAEAE